MMWILFFATMGISLWATMRVRSSYAKWLKVPASSGRTGAEVAQAILDASGIHDVQIVGARGTLSDHYDPIHKRLVLSEANYTGTSVAALGVSAHECGHAIQHKIAYAPLHLRMAAVGVTNFASQMVFWLPLLGMATGLVRMETGLWIMALAWGVIMAFNLITLPVEFDASRRAKVILDRMGAISQPIEKEGVNKVLNAAAWTYVAAFLTSLAYFLWHIIPLLLGRNSDD
jgi:hypothetical protein